MDTHVWQEVGLYDPADAGAGERRALLEYLTARGATVEEMVEADRVGVLAGVAGDLVLKTTVATVTVDEMALRCGVPVERVLRVLLAAGLPVTADATLPADLGEVITAFEEGADLMGEEAVLAFTRVLGAAAINVAEAAVALFYAELGPGTARAGPDELARARVSETATLAFTNVPDVLSRVLLLQFYRATRRVGLARGWPAPDDEAVGVATQGPSETVALGFVDLVGSTAWAEGLSLRDHSLALSRFESAAWSSAVLAGGRIVKMIGDEVFFAAPTVDAACRIGVEVCAAALADPLLPPARGAVGYGPVAAREGDYFGPLVNVVSRLAKVAEPGSLVVTEEAAGSLPIDRWTLHRHDAQRLRGVDSSVGIFTVSRSGRR